MLRYLLTVPLSHREGGCSCYSLVSLVFLCLCSIITFELTFAHVDSSVSQLCMCSYLQNNISRDIAIVSARQAAGGQDEFQIFDKHVKAWTCKYASFTLTVVDVGGLIFAQKCSEARS